MGYSDLAPRNRTKVVMVGGVAMGGANPVRLQSMTNTKTEDVAATVRQIRDLEDAGCEIVRVAVPTMEAAAAIREIKKAIHIPLVADVHFDYRLAIASMENGVDKIRINPGNIGDAARVRQVVDKAKERDVPIRIGVNGGSLPRDVVEEFGGVTAEGVVRSAMDNVKLVEDLGYDNLVVSVKSSDVLMGIRAHEIICDAIPHPLHVGVTESGTVWSGNVKSAVGLGVILYQGIGNAIRVSLTGEPVEEVRSAGLILRTLGLRRGGVTVVSCPTCGRTQIDVIRLAARVEDMVKDVVTDKDVKIAVMGCAVNGPGEAREADFGIAGGVGEGLVFKKGEILRKVPEGSVLGELERLLHESIVGSV